MTVQIGNNVQIEVHATEDTALTVTALTKANPGVATSAAHGLSNGDWGYFAITDGMKELDTQLVRVANIDTNTFELEGINTTNFKTWSAGTFTPILTWNTLCLATNYAVSDGSPTEVDATTTCDTVAQIRYGLPGAKSGSVSIQHDPDVAALSRLEAADSSDVIGFRITYADGKIRGFGAYTAYGGGFSGGVNTLETGEVPVTVPAKIVNYAS